MVGGIFDALQYKKKTKKMKNKHETPVFCAFAEKWWLVRNI